MAHCYNVDDADNDVVAYAPLRNSLMTHFRVPTCCHGRDFEAIKSKKQ